MRNLSTNIEDLKNLLTHLTPFRYRVMPLFLKMNSSLHSRLVSSTYITCIVCAYHRSIPPHPKMAKSQKGIVNATIVQAIPAEGFIWCFFPDVRVVVYNTIRNIFKKIKYIYIYILLNIYLPMHHRYGDW